MKTFRIVLLVAAALCVSTAAQAQEWRGLGRVGGKVIDESGKPVEGVIVKAVMPASQNRGPGDSRTKSNGEWAVGGIAGGQWALDFVKDGYQTASISVRVQEGARIPPMEIVLK